MAEGSPFGMGSPKASIVMESRGGKRGAKELVMELRGRLHADGAAGGGAAEASGSPPLSPLKSSDAPMPAALKALESMLQRKVAEAGAHIADADLADYHIITHRKDAKQCKVAEIGGRRLGRRFDRAQGATFDLGLLSTLGQQRDKRVAAISHSSLSAYLPAKDRGASPALAAAPAPEAAPAIDRRVLAGISRPLQFARSSVDLRSSLAVTGQGPNMAWAPARLPEGGGLGSPSQFSPASPPASSFMYMAPAASEVLGGVDGALDVEEDGSSSDDEDAAAISVVQPAAAAEEAASAATGAVDAGPVGEWREVLDPDVGKKNYWADDGGEVEEEGYPDSPATVNYGGHTADLRGSAQLSLDDVYPDRRSFCVPPPNHTDGGLLAGDNVVGPVMPRKFSLPPSLDLAAGGASGDAPLLRMSSRELTAMAQPPSLRKMSSRDLAAATERVPSLDLDDRVVIVHKRSSERFGSSSGSPVVSPVMRSALHILTDLDDDEFEAEAGAQDGGVVGHGNKEEEEVDAGGEADHEWGDASAPEQKYGRPSTLVMAGEAGRALTSQLSSGGDGSEVVALLATLRFSSAAATAAAERRGSRAAERASEGAFAAAARRSSVAERLSEFMAENAEQFHFADTEDENEEEEEGGGGDDEARRASGGRHSTGSAGGGVGHRPSISGGSGGGTTATTAASGSLYWWDLKPSEGGTWNPAARLWRAGIYCQDAIHERPIKLYRAARRPLQVYAWVQSKGWNALYVGASLCHLGLLLLEPASWAVVDPDTLAYASSGLLVFDRNLHAYPHRDGQLLALAEGMLLTIYAVDSALSLYALGFADIFGVGMERRLLRITNGDDTHYFEHETMCQRWCRRSRSFAAWCTCGLMGARRKKHGSKGDSASSANTRFEKTRLLLWVCMAVDLLWSLGAADLFVVLPAIVTSAHPLRWSRPLRAIMPMVASAELRRWSKMILLTIPEILVLLCFLILIMTIYGIIGIHLFSGDNNCYSAANRRASSADGNEYPAYVVNEFQNIGYALISMYVLSTTENYPLVMYPAYDCHPRSSRFDSEDGSGGSSDKNAFNHLYASFFVSFLVIIMFGINVLSVPMLYSGLIKHIKADAVVGRRLERTALHAAFELLDVEDRGFLTEDQFACLVRELRPDLFIDFKVAAAALAQQRAARKATAKQRKARAQGAADMAATWHQQQQRGRAGCCPWSAAARGAAACRRVAAQGCALLWQRLRLLVGRGTDSRHADFGTAYEACYPEIRKLRYFEALPRGYMLVHFAPESAPGAAASAKAKKRGGGLRFCVRDPTAAASAAKAHGSGSSDAYGTEAAFAASGGFVEKPHFAGAVQLMFGQLARFDFTEDDDADGKIGPMEFFRVPEVVLRDFHSVEVLKQRDSLYTQLFGKRVGAACGGVRDRLLFDGLWKTALRGLDLSLTFAHVVVLAAHVNAPASLASTYTPAAARAAQRWNQKLYELSFAITAAVCAVLVLKAFVLRPKRFFKSKNNRMDLVVVPLALGCLERFKDSPSPYRDLGAMIMSLRLLRLVLSVPLFKKLYVLLVGKEYLVFTLQSVFLFIALWATVGMMLFSGNFGQPQAALSSASGSGFTDPNVGFDSFAAALFTMFQVFTSSNWHELMYRGMESPNLPRFVSPTFFISFHYFCTTVVMQLMIAILVEMYIQISSDPNLANVLSSDGNFERASIASTANHDDSSRSLIDGGSSVFSPGSPAGGGGGGRNSGGNRPGSFVRSASGVSGVSRRLSGSSSHGPSPHRGSFGSSPSSSSSSSSSSSRSSPRPRTGSASKTALAVAKRTHFPLYDDDGGLDEGFACNGDRKNDSAGPRVQRHFTLDGPPRSYSESFSTAPESVTSRSAGGSVATSATPDASVEVPWGGRSSGSSGSGLVELVSTSIVEGDEGSSGEEEGDAAMVCARHASRAQTLGARHERLSRTDSSASATPRSESSPRSSRSGQGGDGNHAAGRARTSSGKAGAGGAVGSGGAFSGVTSNGGGGGSAAAADRSRSRAELSSSSSSFAARGFGGHGSGPPRTKLRANEASFKATASALHVLARRTDRGAFDAVDRELDQGNDLVRGVVSTANGASFSSGGLPGSNSSGSNGGNGSRSRADGGSGGNSSCGGSSGVGNSGGGSDLRRGTTAEMPDNDSSSHNGSNSISSSKNHGPISLRALGTIAVASAREAIRAAAAAEARAQAAAAEVDEIAELLAGASSGKQPLTPQQVARVQEVMSSQVAAQRAAAAAAEAAEAAEAAGSAADPAQQHTRADAGLIVSSEHTL